MKIYFKILLSALALSSLVGCSSTRPNLSNYEKPAAMIALAEVCKSKGLVSESTGSDFQQFTMEMVKKTNYDRKKLSKLYYEQLNGADKEIAKKNIDIKKLCRQVSKEVGIEKEKRIKYNIRQQQRRAIASLSRSMNTINNSFNASANRMNYMNKSATTYNIYKFAPLSRKKRFVPTAVYNANNCSGSVINGQCYGATIGIPKKCYGAAILGKCHGTLL